MVADDLEILARYLSHAFEGMDAEFVEKLEDRPDQRRLNGYEDQLAFGCEDACHFAEAEIEVDVFEDAAREDQIEGRIIKRQMQYIALNETDVCVAGSAFAFEFAAGDAQRFM